MKELKKITTNIRTKEASERLSNLLASLKKNQGQISIHRARAIYACASSVIETLKIEDIQSATNQEKQ